MVRCENISTLIYNASFSYQVMDQWIQKYGKVFGFYMAEIPYMVVSDVDMVKQCLIKEAHLFRDRPRAIIDVEPFRSSLLFLRGKLRGSIKRYSYIHKRLNINVFPSFSNFIFTRSLLLFEFNIATLYFVNISIEDVSGNRDQNVPGKSYQSHGKS